ncbi:MAG: glycosyltransferase family 39 protein [Pseudomonadota bacterium]
MSDARVDTTDERMREQLRGLAVVLGAVLVYCALHVGARLLASPVLGEDDVVEAVFAQDLQVAYDFFPRQPPLYNWVLYGVQQVIGVGVESFLLIKYAALTLTAVLLYLAAFRAFNDRLFAVLSVESLALIYQIAWRYHEGFTHEVLAMVLVMASVVVVFGIVTRLRVSGFVLLGVCAGLGFLTEPTYYVFIVSLFLAVVMQPAARRALFKPMLVVSCVIAAAIASPYWMWVLDDPDRIAAWGRLIDFGSAGSVKNLWAAIRGPFAYLSPLIVLLPIVFPGFLKTARADLRQSANTSDVTNLEQLSLHMALAAFLMSVAGALLLGVQGPAIHVLMPLYLPMVIWLFGVARRSGDTDVPVSRFAKVAIAIACVAFIARLANMFVLDPVCKTCRWGIPYGALAAEMRAQGVRGDGTIVTVDKELAGNLRRYFPNAAIVMRLYPSFTPQDADLKGGQATYVWPKGHRKLPASSIEMFIAPMLPEGVAMSDAVRLTIPWDHLWRESGYRTSTWEMIGVGQDQPPGTAALLRDVGTSQ